MEFVSNLHWFTGRASNIYIWIGQSGLILADTGSPADAKKIAGYIEDIGYQPTDISTIMITHADYDHAGGAAYLQSISGATIFAGTQTSGLLTKGMSPEHLPPILQSLIDRFIRYDPIPQHTLSTVEDGEYVDEMGHWQALETPGHSPDHFAFCSPIHGILIAGDALSTRGGRINIGRKFLTGDQEIANESSRRLLELTPGVIACGHGNPTKDHNAGDLMTLYQSL
jgi:glyoxylase-like metal-dependent hydrolase (beta-lactamase superfamily II)